MVSHLNRRRFLGALSAAVLAGVGIERDVFHDPPHTLTGAATAAPPPHPASGKPVPAAASSQLGPIERVPLPGGGVLNRLPGDGNLLALTLDDGVNTDVVRLYTQFARDTGIRLTYFVNGMYRSWTDNLPLLRPLVESGQIQLGNHTWSHPNLTRVPKSRVAQEISRNDDFLKSTYGVDARPYLRPPYGKHNSTGRRGGSRSRLHRDHTVVGFAVGFHCGHRGLHRPDGPAILHRAGDRDRTPQPPASHPRLRATLRSDPRAQLAHSYPERRLLRTAARHAVTAKALAVDPGKANSPSVE